MARRKKSKSRRRKKTGVSILGLAETYMLLNVATQALFNASPVQFVMGDPGSSMSLTGTQNISLKELFQTSQGPRGTTNSMYDTTNIIKTNFEANWGTALAGMILIPIGFRFGKAIARPAISKTNRLLNKSGMGSTVKL
jgi:hypothetical protein